MDIFFTCWSHFCLNSPYAEAYSETYFADSSLGFDLYFNKGINCLVIIINQKKFELNCLHFKNLTCHHAVLI